MKVGEFYMKGDTLVEIAKLTDCGRVWVDYMGANYPTYQPTDPLPGGGSSGTWAPEDFQPVTDPVLLLRIELTKAHRDEKRARAQLKDARRRLKMLRYAIGVVVPPPVEAPATEDQAT